MEKIMEVQELFNFTNEVAERFKSSCARFSDCLDEIVPLINKEPFLYEKLSKDSKKIILDNIYFNHGFTDEIITTKILQNDSKVTLNGCQLLMLKEMNPDIVKKIVQEHLNPESWEKSAKYVVEEFESYMTDEQKSTLLPEKNQTTNKIKPN